MGLPSNSPNQQREADNGLIMMAEGDMHQGERCPVGSLENPPESNHEEHLSVWEVEDMASFLEEFDVPKIPFNTCAYQEKAPLGCRFYKPQIFAGNIPCLFRLMKTCPCGTADDKPAVGKETSAKSASYPWALCTRYAHLLVDHFEKVLNFEFLSLKEEQLKLEVSELRSRSTKSEERGFRV